MIRFRSLRKWIEAPEGLAIYTFRHIWVTVAVRRVVLIASLAELTGPRMRR